MRARLSRRLVLLGASAALGGCETITDTFDDVFGEKKVRLTGDRQPVLAVERRLDVEPGAARISLPPPQPRAEWPQAGGGPSHAPGHPTLGAPLGEAWRVPVGTGSAYRRRLTAPPIVAGGSVFAIDALGLVTAVDLGTGRKLWERDTRPTEERDGALGGGLAAAGGTLYVVTGLAEALALDPGDGSVRWRAALPAPARGAPTVADGRILVPTVENQLLALSVENGSRLWVYRGQPTVTATLGLPAPAVEGEVVVAGFASGELAAIRAGDGRPIWSETLTSIRGGGLSDIAGIGALPVIDRGRVFAAGMGGITICTDLRSGRRLWERELAVFANLCPAGDAVFLLTEGADLACLGRDDGRVRWATALGRYGDERRRREPITWGGPTLAGGRLLIAGQHGEVAQVDPGNGEVILRSRLPGGAILAPAAAGGRLVYLTETAQLVALEGRGTVALEGRGPAGA